LSEEDLEKNKNKSIKKLEKKIASLEIQLKERDKELMEATDILSKFQEQLKECEELRGKIDKEVEKRLDKLMFKKFDGCKRCKN
jgi:hypothetical protein